MSDFRTITIDTETALILPGLAQPPIACLTWAERVGSTLTNGILNPYDGYIQLKRWLEDSRIRIVGHHVQYDMAGMCAQFPDLLPLVFKAYREGRIVDTVLRQRLRDLGRGLLDKRQAGYYGLAKLSKKYWDVDLDKTTWRHGYGGLIGVPLQEWAEGARKYAIEDACWTHLLYEKQEESGGTQNDVEQSQAGFGFQLMKAWGMRTDPERVAKTEAKYEQAYLLLRQQLIHNRDHSGRSVLRTDGTQDTKFTKELVAMSYPGGKPPLTKTGEISTASEVILECTHPFLQPLKEFKDVQKVLKTFVPVVKRGTFEPICPDINTLVKNGRSSYRNPNLQNLPRKGGIRECFIPREGKLFVDADYDTLEVRTFAQVLYDMQIGTTLMEAYQRNPDFDPHTRLAAQILGISEHEALQRKDAGDDKVKDTRQRAKVCNFGYPGGMGATTFIEYAKAYKLKLTVEEAKTLKNFWKKSVPEVARYFKWVSMQTVGNKRATIQQLRSGRQRGGCMYTDLANTMWSGLAADGVKHAVFNVAEACYTKKESPLYGSRPVVFIHDELMLEADEDRGHEVGMELSRLMCESMEVYTPNVPSRASPQSMRRWYKGAEPVFDQNGRLVPFEPRKK